VQDADPTRPRGEELVATAPRPDLGPLFFGGAPLDLQERPALGSPVKITIEENDPDTVAACFIDRDHPIRVVARQSVGVFDVEAVDGSHGGNIAQPLQAGRSRVSPK